MALEARHAGDMEAMTRRFAAAVFALGCAAACAAGGPARAADCGQALDPQARRVVRGDGVAVAFAPDPASLRVGRHFALNLVVCPPPDAVPAVDADMPAHRHGMNYRARVERVGPAADGRFRATGMMFHMPGRWRVLFDVGSGTARQRLAAEVDIE